MLDVFVNVFLAIPLIGAFAIFALGISLIYRASRVLNLAHGAMAMVSAYMFHALISVGVPMVIGLVLAITFGAGLGVAVELVFVRRLRPQGPTAQTVGTVAVAGLLIALAAKVWGTTPILAPQVFPTGEVSVGGSAVRFGDIGLFLVGIAVSAGLFAFFKFTEVGLAMRGAAQNRRAASLMGIDPDRAASAAWALGGGLAALAGILLAAVTNLDPYNLSLQVLPAFVAVLIGGLQSLLGALVGAVIAGLAFGLVPSIARLPGLGILGQPGSAQLVLTVLALVVMALRGRRIVGAEASEAGLVGGGEGLRSAYARRYGAGAFLTVVVLLLFPLLVPFSILGDALLAMELAIIALSVVVLTGWVGQISLAQASFVGIGALVTAIVVRSWGLGFPFSLLVGAGIGAAAAVALGTVALRVRGLYLAVATLIFAWMADQFLFPSPWMGAGTGVSTIPNQRIGRPGGFPSLDMTSRTVLYFLLLAVVVLVVVALANVRSTKTGRAFFAVRGSEMAAASLGIDVTRTKLMAFAISGLLAGLGGSLLLIEQRTVVPAQFLFTMSLQFLAIAVVGGLTSLGGALASGGLFAGLNEVFFRVRALSGWLEVVSAGLLAFVLLVYPGGLAAVPQGVRRLAGRLGAFKERWRVARSTAAEAPAPVSREAVDAAEAQPGPLERLAEARARVASQTRRAMGKVREALPEPARAAGGRVGRVFRRAAVAPVRPPDWFSTLTAGDPGEESNGTGAGEPKALMPGASAHKATGAVSTNGSPKEPKDQVRLGAFVGVTPELPPERGDREPLVEAERVTVRFGGLTAVNDATLAVRRGEIVGLIGPNGAGKTTLFNAILGLNDPAAGRIRLYGQDVTDAPPHIRARFGVARTFQVIQLFNELSVFDNLLVATHLHNPSGVLSNLAATGKTLTAEMEARDRVRAILRLLDLEDVAQEGVRNLPFGSLRMVELGRALVTGAQVAMLDEPASGLNEQETDRLIDVVRAIRALGVSVLLIEHDVRMVTGVSDYVYVLDQGRMISEGPPSTIVKDQRVIDAYLGAAPADATVGGGA